MFAIILGDNSERFFPIDLTELIELKMTRD